MEGAARRPPDDERIPFGYTLYVESNEGLAIKIAARIDAALESNPHYAYCRALSQIAPLSVFQIEDEAARVFLTAALPRPRRLGDVKPTASSPDAGWSRRFAGRYLTADASASRGR